jgi:hypothetical protein
MIVDCVNQSARRDFGLCMEDQVFPKLPHLLKICGDSRGLRFLAPPPILFLLVCLAAARFSAFVIPQRKLFLARGANYQLLGANGGKPRAVAGVEKSAGESYHAPGTRRAR